MSNCARTLRKKESKREKRGKKGEKKEKKGEKKKRGEIFLVDVRPRIKDSLARMIASGASEKIIGF